ncbi:MAG: CopG family transcriptional regulator [Alphaproteobacteria bacterium]|nr:CopG family transcriptional regulator [Alphaproteobacteria bacterium]
MARPKSQKKSSRFSVSLDDESYKALQEAAKREDVTIAWLVRRAVHEMIERPKPIVLPGGIKRPRRAHGTN